ncbi:MAG: alpha-L-fucosidase [Candidatus Methylacidiphilales bacterium]|nr:alpha-L-fucosidase [Candidatus Methylacidiphilales bacterium]
MNWFLESRFGLSFHWGLYSISGRGEWVRSAEQLSEAQYEHYFQTFSPAHGWAERWAELALSAGAHYCILTARHHDGFCLWDSKLTNFTSTRAPACGRDLIHEYTSAMRQAGLRVGLYYSLVDWHHPDCPAYGDRQHPLRHKPESRERDLKCNWAEYVTCFHGQIKELLTRYGKIDLLVLDFSYWHYSGATWRAVELLEMVRRLQPGIIVNDRLGNGALKECPPPGYAGDYDQTEQNIPRAPVTNAQGIGIPWEAWFTLNNSWGYCPNDLQYKTARDVVHSLVNTVSKNGNLLVNVSPDARGNIPGQATAILAETGRWLRTQAESIRGCGAAGLDKPEWGRWTRRGNVLYAHLLNPVIGHINLPGLRARVKNARVLATGCEATICDYWNPGVQTFDQPEDIFLALGKPTSWTHPMPDSIDTVVRMELTDESEYEELIRQYQKDFAQAISRVPLP